MNYNNYQRYKNGDRIKTIHFRNCLLVVFKKWFILGYSNRAHLENIIEV